MDSLAIFEKIQAIEHPAECAVVFSDGDYSYFGKDRENNTVFMIVSRSSKILPVFQETHSLSFSFNKKCRFIYNEEVNEKAMHVLTCKVEDKDKVLAFIRLTRAFAQNEPHDDQYYLSKLFSSISALFDKRKDVSDIELQGLFAELYSIIFFYENGCDISECWQSHSKMKFDFSLSDKKRIEVKSTTRANRVHHFKHDQLLSELYDIKIISIMLQKNDYGISLGDVVDAIRKVYPDQYALLLHIESTIAHVEKEDLFSLRYDQSFLESNIRFFDALSIPHFNEKTPEGVFNAEYDCDLENISSLPLSVLKNWISEE